MVLVTGREEQMGVVPTKELTVQSFPEAKFAALIYWSWPSIPWVSLCNRNFGVGFIFRSVFAFSPVFPSEIWKAWQHQSPIRQIREGKLRCPPFLGPACLMQSKRKQPIIIPRGIDSLLCDLPTTDTWLQVWWPPTVSCFNERCCLFNKEKFRFVYKLASDVIVMVLVQDSY